MDKDLIFYVRLVLLMKTFNKHKNRWTDSKLFWSNFYNIKAPHPFYTEYRCRFSGSVHFLKGIGNAHKNS